MFSDPAAVGESTSKSALESSEAVSQLLNAVPDGGQMEETEWEEVIISDAHILANNVLAEDGGSAAGVALGQESQLQGDSSAEQAEKDSLGLGMPPSSEVLSPNASAKKPVVWVSFPYVMGMCDVCCVLMGQIQEIKDCWQCFARDPFCVPSAFCQFRIVPLR